MKNKYAKGITIVLILLLIAVNILAIKTYRLESSKRSVKADLIELSDIKYGMFNVDKWKEKIAVIITKKIKDLKITGKNRREAKQKITKFLYQIVNNFEHDYKAKNRKKSWFGISIKNIGADFFSIFDEFRNNIPKITDQILDFLEKKENRNKIKEYILSQLNKYTANTFQKIDYTSFNNILLKYNTNNEVECKETIQQKMATIDHKLTTTSYIFIALFMALFGIIIFNTTYSKTKLILYVLIAFHFLLLGILLPMIDIDARIGSMEFKLLGEPIVFDNQVLYYKSKSIVEMAKIMLSQDKIKIILVGLLVLLFSVIFPTIKLISTILVAIKEKLLNNKIINFLVFKSGKWSMADVMVVAIFMSYIGFSGIVSSQLSQLENTSDRLKIITTNHSELLDGFFFFVGFVLISISVSQIVMNRYDKTKKRTQS